MKAKQIYLEPEFGPDMPSAEREPASGMGPDTYVLYAPWAHNAVRAELQGSEAKAVTELRMARLMPRHSVTALVQDPLGKWVIAPPVSAGDHWLKDGEDGRVDERTFLRALAQRSLPWHIKFRRDTEDDLGTMRLAEC